MIMLTWYRYYAFCGLIRNINFMWEILLKIDYLESVSFLSFTVCMWSSQVTKFCFKIVCTNYKISFCIHRSLEKLVPFRTEASINHSRQKNVFDISKSIFKKFPPRDFYKSFFFVWKKIY